jgi:hypothetical protein
MGLLDKAATKTRPVSRPASSRPEPPVSLKQGRADEGFLSKGQAKKNALTVSPQGITDGIRGYLSCHTGLQGIVVEMTKDYGNSTDFAGELGRIVSSMGEALPLPARFCLVLIPAEADRELLAHRLSRSLKTTVSFHFRAESLDKALKLLHAYL